MASFHIGLSGYSYKEWQGEGRFYPPELKQSKWLKFYADRYNALEADGTWYQMPSETGVSKWIAETPEGFRVSPKMHREVTHYARLKPTCIDSLKFFLKRLEPLESAGKLGALLIQLPPNLKRDDERLSTFLAEIPYRGTLPWSIEFRSETWHTLEVEQILRDRGVAWVANDTDDDDAQSRDTGSHVYARLRKTDYPDDLLKDWAQYFDSKLREGKDCYVYCKHQDAEAPWEWADRLIELVKG